MREITGKLFNEFSAILTSMVLGAGVLSVNERVLIAFGFLRLLLDFLRYLGERKRGRDRFRQP